MKSVSLEVKEREKKFPMNDERKIGDEDTKVECEFEPISIASMNRIDSMEFNVLNSIDEINEAFVKDEVMKKNQVPKVGAKDVNLEFESEIVSIKTLDSVDKIDSLEPDIVNSLNEVNTTLVKNEEINKFQALKITNEEVTIEFEFEPVSIVSKDKNIITDSRKIEISKSLEEVNRDLSSIEARLSELNVDIDRLTNNAEILDYMVAVGSGVLAGIIDSLWVGEFSLDGADDLGEKIVKKIAKLDGYTEDSFEGAIRHLEKNHPIPSDNAFDLISSTKYHHLDDLAHHPTPVGLICSILTQFTKKGYFNVSGMVISTPIRITNGKLYGEDIPSKIFAGTINWFFHLVSDMAGSTTSKGRGMGIPGPIVSLLNELSIIPGLDKTGLAVKTGEFFAKNKFDLRKELGVIHQLGKQAVPVLLNEVIVRSFYFISRLVKELKEKKCFDEIDWEKTIPLTKNNRTLARMLTIATGTFTAVDLIDAGIRGGIKAVPLGFTPAAAAAFGKEFILRVNFVGVARFAIAVGIDVSMGVKREKARNERMALNSRALHLMNAKVYYMQAEAWVAAETTEETINEAVVMMEKAAIIHMSAWEDINQSTLNMGKSRDNIERNNPGLLDWMVDELS